MRNKGRQRYGVVTVNGRVLLRRVRWWTPGDGANTPLARRLDEPEETVSQGVREMACRLSCATTSFEKAAENLDRLAHVRIGKEMLRQLVENEGRMVRTLQERGRLVPEFSADDCATSEGKTRMYVGCDGVNVPLITDDEKKKRREQIRQKRRRRGRKCKPLPSRRKGSDLTWKECRVVIVHDEPQTHREVRATSGNHEKAGRLMRRVATETGFMRADERIAIIDGAPWIRNQIELHGLARDVGLDYHHLRDYVRRTRLVLFGETSDEGRAWGEHIMEPFREKGFQAAWDALLKERKRRRGAKRAALGKLLNYVAERADMIRYRAFRERGWRIGSGPTEAQCKTSTLRLKGRGRRWDARNADAIMALSCLESSRAWRRYWRTLDHHTT